MSTYYAFLEDEVRGPFQMTELEAMAQKGRIVADTQIARAEAPENWLSWHDLRLDGVKQHFPGRFRRRHRASTVSRHRNHRRHRAPASSMPSRR